MVDYDPEHTKKVIEWIKYISLQCRDCHQQRFDHEDFSPTGNNTAKAFLNKCKEFVPPDNLDYIEWLAKKRGLV
jgi:hypothetical protein